MKNNTVINMHKGFTLAELLVAMAVVSICVVMALAVTLPKQKSALKSQYMNALNALDKAYYNGVIIGHNPFTTLDDDEGNPPEHSDTRDTGTKILCQALTSYINTPTNVRNADGTDYSTTCSDTKLTNPLARKEDFTEDKVQFVAANGMKFYMTKQLWVEDDEDQFKYYIVFVDVNGNKPPNSLEYTDDKGNEIADYTANISNKEIFRTYVRPDIFAFAMLNTGRICPLGIPEYDEKVMTAGYAYFDSDGSTLYSNEPIAYYQAKGAAWGYYDYTHGPNLDECEDFEPFTFNDYIRAKLAEEYPESKIVKYFPDLGTLTPVAVASGEPSYCSNADYESCYVYLDNYR